VLWEGWVRVCVKNLYFFYCYIIYLFFTSNLLVIYYPSLRVSNFTKSRGCNYISDKKRKKKKHMANIALPNMENIPAYVKEKYSSYSLNAQVLIQNPLSNFSISRISSFQNLTSKSEKLT